MKLLRLSVLTGIAFAGLSGAALFHTAQKVQESEAELRRLQLAVAQEQQMIRVLRAEWDYLNRPDRLESLARERLDLVPPSPPVPQEVLRPQTKSVIDATPAVVEPSAGRGGIE